MRRTVLKGSRIPAGGVPPMPWVRPGLAGTASRALVRVDLDCERPRPTPPTPPSQGGENEERLPLVPSNRT